MHPAPAFRWTDQATMLDTVRAAPFARLFAQTPDGPRVAHVPMLATTTDGGGVVLRFHLANANALRPHLPHVTALAVFDGPDGYLSANWYADVRGNVPTWNYLAVECEGTARAMVREDLITLVDDLSAALEPSVGENWTRAKMEPARFEAMLGAITGFHLTVTALRGTRKVSQNKPDGEAARVLAGMEGVGATAIAAAMRAARA